MRRFEPLLVALALGLAVFVLVGGRDGDARADLDPAPAAGPVATPVELVEPPAPEVAELPPSVSRVLESEGHTEFVGRDVLGSSVPPSVVSVLIDRGVVLRVAEVRP